MMATEWHVREGTDRDRTSKTVAISTPRLLHGTQHVVCEIHSMRSCRLLIVRVQQVAGMKTTGVIRIRSTITEQVRYTCTGSDPIDTRIF